MMMKKSVFLSPPIVDMSGNTSPISPSVMEAGMVSPSVFTKLLSDRDRTCEESWIDVPCESVLADLSEDLQAHVNSFLGAKDLCALSEVSRHFHKLSSETESWFPLLRNRYPFLGQLADLKVFGVDVGSSVKQVFLSKRRQAVQRVRLEQSQFQRTKLDYFLHVFSDPCLFVLIFGLLFWGALSLGLSRPPYFTASSLLPLYVLLVSMFTLVTALCCARHCAHGSAFPYSPFSITAYVRATGVAKIIMNRTLSNVPFYHAIAYGAFCSFCLFWLLLFLRISSTISVSYAVVFFPLFVFFAVITTIVPFILRSTDLRTRVMQMSCSAMFVVIPALCFTVLMFYKLLQGFGPNSSLPMKYVMLPLFALDFLFLCVAIVGAFYFKSFAPVQIFVGLIGPYAVFEYLLTVMLDPSFFWPQDSALQWGSIFIPLYVGLGLECVLALALAFATYSSAHHNPAILCARPPTSMAIEI